MIDAMRIVYNTYTEKLEKQLKELAETKKLLNMLAKEMNKDIPFPDVDNDLLIGSKPRIRVGQFKNKPLATAAREYMQMRKDRDRDCMSIDFYNELLPALEEGGYDVPKTKNEKISMRLTLIRNTTLFILVKDDFIGLKDWFPEKKTKKVKTGNGDGVAEDQDEEVGQDDDPIEGQESDEDETSDVEEGETSEDAN